MGRRVNDCAFLGFCLMVGISANPGRPCRAYRSWYWKPGLPSKLFRNPRVSLGKGGFQIDLSGLWASHMIKVSWGRPLNLVHHQNTLTCNLMEIASIWWPVLSRQRLKAVSSYDHSVLSLLSYLCTILSLHRSSLYILRMTIYRQIFYALVYHVSIV